MISDQNGSLQDKAKLGGIFLMRKFQEKVTSNTK